jgi:hypothetical protein
MHINLNNIGDHLKRNDIVNYVTKYNQHMGLTFIGPQIVMQQHAVERAFNILPISWIWASLGYHIKTANTALGSSSSGLWCHVV